MERVEHRTGLGGTEERWEEQELGGEEGRTARTCECMECFMTCVLLFCRGG